MPSTAKKGSASGLETTLEEVQDHYPEFGRLLGARQNEILGRTATIRHNLEEQVVDSPGDAADESVIDLTADYFLKLANNDQLELIEIRDAQERIDRGTFGICQSCDQPIAIERLRSVPTAHFDVSCQAAREDRAHNQRLRVMP